MTLVTIFLTAGSALRGTVERESPKVEEYVCFSGLNGLEATKRVLLAESEQTSKVAEQQKPYLVVLPLLSDSGLPKAR